MKSTSSGTETTRNAPSAQETSTLVAFSQEVQAAAKTAREAQTDYEKTQEALDAVRSEQAVTRRRHAKAIRQVASLRADARLGGGAGESKPTVAQAQAEARALAHRSEELGEEETELLKRARAAAKILKSASQSLREATSIEFARMEDAELGSIVTFLEEQLAPRLRRLLACHDATTPVYTGAARPWVRDLRIAYPGTSSEYLVGHGRIEGRDLSDAAQEDATAGSHFEAVRSLTDLVLAIDRAARSATVSAPTAVAKPAKTRAPQHRGGVTETVTPKPAAEKSPVEMTWVKVSDGEWKQKPVHQVLPHEVTADHPG
ncbi:MAG: hypothetical protein ACQGVK_09890 [Myxococcota bacterium]